MTESKAGFLEIFVERSGKRARIFGKARAAESAFERMKGLMFESEKNFDYALVFKMPSESRMGSSIHMMFVFFPIDVLFLDSKGKIVDAVQGLRPWALNCTPKKPAKFIVEMPEGSVKSKRLKTGERILF